MRNIVDECYKKSVLLLKANSHKYGTMAAAATEAAKEKIYINIFGRDMGICALGMVASRNKDLVDYARRGLLTLSSYQTERGQIPSSVNPVTGQVSHYILGHIDSTLWWLLALDFYDRFSGDKELKLKLLPNIKSAFLWLFCQDHNNDGLLEEGESYGWADDLPVSGRVLYTNALWYRVLKRYGYAEEAKLAREGLNILFRPHRKVPKRSAFVNLDPRHRSEEVAILRELSEEVPYYLHFVGYKNASDRCDVFGNSLAVLLGISTAQFRKKIIRWIRAQKLDRKYPVRVLEPPIDKRDFDWHPFMERETCLNEPYSYHNGGTWPFAGAFYVMALHKNGRKETARKALRELAAANKLNKWEFNEWLDGKSGRPRGMPGQSWNAGAFILACHYLNGEIRL